MNLKVRIFGILTAMTVLIAGAIGAATYASAQTPGNTPQAQKDEQSQQRRDDFLGKVASKLNVTLDQLKQAFKDAAIETVDQALADGKISQDQAAKFKDRIANGNGLGIGRFLRAHRDERGEYLARLRNGIIKSSATALNTTPGDLREQLKSGKSIAQVASDKGVSPDAVKAQITTDAKAKLDKRVANNRLTQARADTILQKLTDKLDDILNKVPKAKASNAQ